jgi:O-antigen/teichoic acid export membrane protein
MRAQQRSKVVDEPGEQGRGAGRAASLTATPPSRPTGRHRSVRRDLGRQLAWVTSGRVMAAGLQAVLLILTARALEVAEFGHLMAFVGVVTLAQVLVDCGVSIFISRERAAAPESGGVTTALRFTMASSAALMVVLAIGLAVAAVLVSPVYWSMLPLAVWAGGERNADTRLSVVFADGDVHVPVLNLVTRRACTILLFSASVRGDVAPVLGFSVASAITALSSATFANLFIRKRVTARSSLTFRELLRISRPFWVSNIASQARNLDAVLVSAFGGAAQSGLYASGSRLINPLQILPASLASILLPASARALDSRRALRKLLAMTIVVVLGLSAVYAGIFVATPWLVSEGLGARYDGAAEVIRIILVGLPFASATALFTSILIGRGHGHAVAVVSSAATICCLAGICVVAPFAGAAGAAGVVSASFVVQALAMGVPMRQLWAESA